ncbi:hypothetical protein RN001_015368 [Aquatica leii]|uniref:Kinesin-like protein n=1 Tax=Aquatica leii TaxID=1421715 RepID=A0AAN7NZ35_9COLE|nr:hypothetical protein RN001_015368 [Aquatica leii]
MDTRTEEFVNVAIRIRPSLNVLEESIGIKVISETPPILYAVNRQSYTFNNIFTSKASQKDVYNDIVKPLVQKVLLGYNCTVFAYGQTGTGKTYTMGSDPKTYSDPGFIVRTFNEIFAYQEEYKDLEVYVSFYEIYKEKVFDLLSNSKKSLQVKGFKIDGLAQVKVYTPNEAQNLLNIGSKNRHVGDTKLNANSSRSHAIFTMFCNVKNENVKTEAKLNLVDLAGSESVRKTGTEGSQFQEGVNINMGLYNIRRVISALSANMSHVPYRESMITTILQDSLSRTNFVTLVACISPDLLDMSETIQTLEFAQGAKKMKNKPEVNTILQQYKKENPALFERPQLTNSAVKQKATPLKRHYSSTECLATPILPKTSKAINHTWTPMSTITEPLVEPTPFPALSPIVRKCVEVFETTVMKKFDVMLQSHRLAEKCKTPQFPWEKLQNEVSQIVRNEIVQMTGQRPRNCSSPIENHDISNISGVFSEEPSVIAVAKRLDFNETFKKPDIPVKKPSKKHTVASRRSARLSRVLVAPKRQSMRLHAKTSETPKPNRFSKTSSPKKAKKIDDIKKNHLKHILSILNDGNEKELQKLPSVGPKTAVQIRYFRDLHGSFETIADLKKMDSWRANGYQSSDPVITSKRKLQRKKLQHLPKEAIELLKSPTVQHPSHGDIDDKDGEDSKSDYENNSVHSDDDVEEIL